MVPGQCQRAVRPVPAGDVRDQCVKHAVVGTLQGKRQLAGTRRGQELLPGADARKMEQQLGTAMDVPSAVVAEGQQQRRGARAGDDAARVNRVALLLPGATVFQKVVQGTQLAAGRVDLDLDGVVLVVIEARSMYLTSCWIAGTVTGPLKVRLALCTRHSQPTAAAGASAAGAPVGWGITVSW